MWKNHRHNRLQTVPEDPPAPAPNPPVTGWSHGCLCTFPIAVVGATAGAVRWLWRRAGLTRVAWLPLERAADELAEQLPQQWEFRADAAAGLIKLDDARERQILRTAGPAYQFRHARLQDRLAHNHQAMPGMARTQSS